jgi:hypothetical protein
MPVNFLFRSAMLQLPRLSLRAVCTLLLVVTPQVDLAQPPAVVAPSDVEAAYLYNFGKFVRFPSVQGQESPNFLICMLGEDSFGSVLDSLIANESIQGHRIAVRRLASAAAAASCQIVFIAPSEEPHLEKDLTALKNKPILTVSSIPRFLDRGGMIEFQLLNNRVRFAVNLAAAEKNSLALSSELLKVAVRVDANPALEAK